MSPDSKIHTVWTEPSTLKLTQDSKETPKRRDPTELPGGSRLGLFWMDCKDRRLCGRPPYDRLLTNPVLRADYRAGNVRIHRGTREQQSNGTGSPPK